MINGESGCCGSNKDHPARMSPQCSEYPPNTMKPDCFPTTKMYKEWVYLANVVREVSSICDDCSSEYKKAMISKERCHELSQKTILYGKVMIIKQRKEHDQVDFIQDFQESEIYGSDDESFGSTADC
jgi:hypothetical protein